ncbi:MAG: histidine kinase [Ktedonobacterales bacterium]
MASEPVIAGLSQDAAAALAQVQRDNERLRLRAGLLEEQVRSLVVLQEIANTVSGELALGPLLHRIVAAALRVTAAQASALYLLDETEPVLIVRATANEQSAADSGAFPSMADDDDAQPAADRLPLTSGLAGQVASRGELALIVDAEHDPRFAPETFVADARVLGILPSGLLAVPLLYKGTVTGVLEVGHTAQAAGFDASSLDLIRTLAAQAATAVENARVYRRLRGERDRIITTQEDERRRLAHDLHDGPAQKLAQIAMALEYAEQLAQHDPKQVAGELRRLREMAVATTREIRQFLFDLRPLVLEAETGDLVVALEHYLDRFRGRPGPGPRLQLHAEYPDRMPHNVEVTVFAIVQEAVNNVLKHARAHSCAIEVRETADKLVTTVRDDGTGFDIKQVEAEYETRGSWGLVSMLERAALVEGKLTVASQPGRGTLVSLEVPR